jgi:hypothetical protein
MQDILQQLLYFALQLIALSHVIIECVLLDVFKWRAVGLSTQIGTRTLTTSRLQFSMEHLVQGQYSAIEIGKVDKLPVEVLTTTLACEE